MTLVFNTQMVLCYDLTILTAFPCFDLTIFPVTNDYEIIHMCYNLENKMTKENKCPKT